MVFFVGGLGECGNHQLKQFYHFLDVVIFGNFYEINVVRFDSFVDDILKILLYFLDDFFEVA